MTGYRLKQSAERRLNIALDESAEDALDEFLNTLNTAKDELCEDLKSFLGERYFTVSTISPIVTDGDLRYVILPYDAMGGLYSLFTVPPEGESRVRIHEITDEPLNAEVPNIRDTGERANSINPLGQVGTEERAYYYFKAGRANLVKVDDNVTNVEISYDRYPLNIQRIDLVDTSKDLSESTNLPRPAHTALLRKVVYEMMMATDSSYRAGVIDKAEKSAERALERAISVMKNRNQSRYVLERQTPIVQQ